MSKIIFTFNFLNKYSENQVIFIEDIMDFNEWLLLRILRKINDNLYTDIDLLSNWLSITNDLYYDKYFIYCCIKQAMKILERNLYILNTNSIILKIEILR